MKMKGNERKETKRKETYKLPTALVTYRVTPYLYLASPGDFKLIALPFAVELVIETFFTPHASRLTPHASHPESTTMNSPFPFELPSACCRTFAEDNLKS